MPKGAKLTGRWSPEELKDQFAHVAERKKITNASFIKYADLKELWNTTPQGERESRLVLLLRRHIVGNPKIPSRLEERLRRDYLRILSILVYISWTRWKDFREIFIESWDEQEDRTATRRHDTALPFSPEALESDDFLGSRGSSFYENQFFFSPIVIRYEQINTSRKGSRVPVISSRKIGEGAYGKVFEEVVAPGYIEVSEQHDLNTTAKAVARKCITAKESFRGESNNVSHLQSCLSQHRGITRSLGMIVWEDDHETRFDIFYELASFDLRRFLNGPDKAEGYLDYFSTNPDHYANFNSGHLLEQMAHLADALRHLHSGYWHPSMGRVCLAHNDFKPENILIFHSSSSLYPAGIWKIADFGLSNIKQDKSGQSQTKHSSLALAPRDLIVQISPTTCRRNPAGYSAPEIERQGFVQDDGRESDIWSFGCVFSLVLALCLGRTLTVSELNGLRSSNGNDRFYEKQIGSYKSFKVKTPVFDWLTDLPNLYLIEGDWVQQCVDLIFDIFRVAAAGRGSPSKTNSQAGHIFSLVGRPTGETIRDRIHRIRENTQGNWIVSPPLQPVSVETPTRPHTPPYSDSLDGLHPSSSPPGSHGLWSLPGIHDRNTTNDAPNCHPADIRDISHKELRTQQLSILNLERSSTDLAIKRKPISGLAIQLQPAIPKILKPESSVYEIPADIGKAITEEPRSATSSPWIGRVPSDSSRPVSAATDPGSPQPTSSPIRHTNSAPEHRVSVSSASPHTPPSVQSSASTTPGPRHSSLVPDPLHHTITRSDMEPSSRVKFPIASMSHTRVSPDGKHVAFWTEKKDRKVMICHLSFPSHCWSRDTRVMPMAQYVGLQIVPPRGYKCAIVALSGDRAVIHFKTSEEAEIHIYELASKQDYHNPEGSRRSSFRCAAGLLDVSMAVNGNMVMRFINYVLVGHVDQNISKFNRPDTAGSTVDASITPCGEWLTVLSHDKTSRKEHWYVRALPRPGQDSSSFQAQGWTYSQIEANYEAIADRPCSIIPLHNAMARLYTSGFATLHLNSRDKSSRIRLHSGPVASASMTPDGTSLVYIGVGSRRSQPTLSTIQIRTGNDNQISLELPSVLSTLRTSWKEWDDCERHFALGEGTDQSGNSALFAFISSSDGTIERVKLTENQSRVNSTASSTTPPEVFQARFYGPDQVLPAQPFYTPNQVPPPQTSYIANQSPLPRSYHAPTQTPPRNSYHSPDHIQATQLRRPT